MILYENDKYFIIVQRGLCGDSELSFIWDNYNIDGVDIEKELEKYENNDLFNAIMLFIHSDEGPVGVLCGYRVEDIAVQEHFFLCPEHRGNRVAWEANELFKKWARYVGCKYYLGKKNGAVFRRSLDGN